MCFNPITQSTDQVSSHEEIASINQLPSSIELTPEPLNDTQPSTGSEQDDHHALKVASVLLQTVISFNEQCCKALNEPEFSILPKLDLEKYHHEQVAEENNARTHAMMVELCIELRELNAKLTATTAALETQSAAVNAMLKIHAEEAKAKELSEKKASVKTCKITKFFLATMLCLAVTFGWTFFSWPEGSKKILNATSNALFSGGEPTPSLSAPPVETPSINCDNGKEAAAAFCRESECVERVYKLCRDRDVNENYWHNEEFKANLIFDEKYILKRYM